MRMSQLLGTRYKESPAEARLTSHVFLLRGGYIRQVANGIYSLLPPAKRIVAKIEKILREEMERIGMQEVLMPLVQPRELWDESGRYTAVGSELVRFNDRTDHPMVLAMTHEEAVVALCRTEIQSYTQLPFAVYQIQTKFRDEPRSRGGLIRVREFTMKDAYSFHRTTEDLDEFYQRCLEAYHRVFRRAGIPEVVSVQSDTGMMGGRIAHEFMLLCEAGEDTVVVCDSCDYRANLEVASAKHVPAADGAAPLEKVHTPGQKTIEDVAAYLGVTPEQTAKAVFFSTGAGQPLVFAVVRGDLEINEAKLARHLGAMPNPAEDAAIRAIGAVPGYASPLQIDRSRCRVLVDPSVAASAGLVCGANEEDYHYRNFNVSRDLPEAEFVDLAQVAEGELCSQCGTGHLQFQRGIEVGNIFQLGTKYSASMSMSYSDENGRPQVPIMGCYGIGVGRLVSSVLEVRHDQYGPCWPMSIAPWQVALVGLNSNVPATREAAEELYAELLGAGIEVLYDDRAMGPGPKFAEADLLGIPLRLIVSERNLAQGMIEWKRRDTGDRGTIPRLETLEFAKKIIQDATRVD